MKTKANIISIGAFAVFFIIGWQFGFSPVKKSFETVSENVRFVKQEVFGLFAGNIPPNYISDNQYKTDILHYDLAINLYPKEKFIVGKVVITGVFKDSNVKKLDLNFYDNMKINYLAVDEKVNPYILEETRLSIPFTKEKDDTFTVEIHYKGTPKKVGLSSFVFGEINGRSVVYNLNEPTFASTWYPCNDIPEDKAYLDFHITNDSIYTSVSNGKLISEKITNTRKTYHWKTFYPISTYLISVYSAEYVNFTDYYHSDLNKDSLPLEYYTFPEHVKNGKTDFADHPNMIKFFANTFGEYPFMKEKYGVAEFLWQLGAMEHQTITGIGSNFVSGNNFYNDVYVHELSHHWWGDAVGPKSWKDIWLNEGFASYCEALYDEHKAGSKALASTMLAKYQDNFSGTLYNPGESLINMFSQTIYDKGAWVLHMLRYEVGDSSFFKILRNYFEEYKYKSASTEDFIKVCETTTGKGLDQFFDQWVYTGNDQIKLNIEWTSEHIENNSYIIKMNFKQLQQRYKNYNFPIEIKFADYNSNGKTQKYFIDEREKTISEELKFKPQIITADPNHWLLAEINVTQPKSNEH